MRQKIARALRDPCSWMIVAAIAGCWVLADQWGLS